MRPAGLHGKFLHSLGYTENPPGSKTKQNKQKPLKKDWINEVLIEIIKEI